MNAPAEQLAQGQEPTVEPTEEEIFEEAFNERFGENAAGQPEVPADSPDAGRTEDQAAGDPPPQEGEDPAGSQQAGNEEEEAQVPEWFNDLPDEAKDAFTKTAAELATVQDQYTSLHGRLAPVQQENARLRQQLETPQPAPQATPPQGQPALATTPELDLSQVEEFAEFKEAFPEEAKAMEAIFSRQAQHLADLRGQLGQVSQGLERVQTASMGNEREKALEKLKNAHPDWMTVRPSEDFENWRKTQPPSVSRMADSSDPDECIYVLDRYKQDVYLQRQLSKKDGEPAPTPPETSVAQAARERRQHLRSVPGMDPQASDVGVPTGDPEQFMSEEQIWEQEVERRLRAQRDSQR